MMAKRKYQPPPDENTTTAAVLLWLVFAAIAFIYWFVSR